jgi:hypothetical protein
MARNRENRVHSASSRKEGEAMRRRKRGDRGLDHTTKRVARRMCTSARSMYDSDSVLQSSATNTGQRGRKESATAQANATKETEGVERERESDLGRRAKK